MEEIDLSVLCTTERKSNPVIVKIHSWNPMIVSDRTSSLETYMKNEKIIRPNIKAVYVPRGCVDRYKKTESSQILAQKYFLCRNKKKSSATVGFPDKVGSPGDTALIYIAVLMNHRQLHLEILFIGIPCRTDECVHIAVLCFPAEDFFCKV